MKRIAVIGSGIAGLTAAYYLSRKHQVFLLEREDRLGGHTHTVMVDSSVGPLAVDTGFIVHNDLTYPNLIRLLAELGVPRVNSDMSFAVSCRSTGYEYSSRGVSGFFAQKRTLLSARPWKLFREIRRFNREAAQLLAAPLGAGLTMGEFLEEGKFSQEFRQLYLVPMAAAVWSCAPAAVDEFPAATLLRFFDNHRFLTVTGQAQWKTIPGGCSRYLAPITKPLGERIFTGAQIRGVARDPLGVTVRFAGERPPLRFDEVVFATHGDQILPMLDDASRNEREVLGAFRTTRNEVVLHTDDQLLPRRAAARASWNYLLHLEPGDRSGPATMTYHMNRLQSLPTRENYCVTLNATEHIRPEKILRRFTYHHPLYGSEAIRAQQRWKEISGVNRTHFCGAYWGYGFHEDGVNSGLRVARSGGVQVER